MRPRIKNKAFGLDPAYIKQYMALSVEGKFRYLYRLNEFVKTVLPRKSKKARVILKEKGW